MPLGDEFKGLPMEDLIGTPLSAACSANLKLAQATADYIQAVGFEYDEEGKPTKAIRKAEFRYSVPGPDNQPVEYTISTPLLAIVPIPSLKVNNVDITFDMEVRSSESHKDSTDASASLTATGSGGWGPFKLSVSVSGSVSTHKENTRTSDKSAKYHVQVTALDSGMSEGLARVLDIMNKSVVPVPAAAASTPATT